MERKSEAVEPGKAVGVEDTSTVILDADDADQALFFVIQNVSDEAITLRLAAAGAVVDQGIVLNPGGVWREENYAGAVCAIHAAAGETKNLSVVIC